MDEVQEQAAPEIDVNDLIESMDSPQESEEEFHFDDSTLVSGARAHEHPVDPGRVLSCLWI